MKGRAAKRGQREEAFKVNDDRSGEVWRWQTYKIPRRKVDQRVRAFPLDTRASVLRAPPSRINNRTPLCLLLRFIYYCCPPLAPPRLITRCALDTESILTLCHVIYAHPVVFLRFPLSTAATSIISQIKKGSFVNWQKQIKIFQF